MSTGNTGARGDITDRVVDDYSGYKVYDERGEKLGKVEYTILDHKEQPQYLGVNTGFFGTKTTLLPEEIVNLDDQDGSFSVQTSESRVKDAPTFDSHSDIDSAYEDRVREHYGLGTTHTGTSDEHHREESRRDEPAGERRDHDRTRDEARHDEARHEETVRREETASDGYDHGTSDSRDHASHSGAVTSGGSHTETRDTEDIERRDESSRTSRQTSDGDREQVRVTLKRQKAHAERVIGADGEEEVRIRKTTVTEEKLVDVEDPK